jgi:hypothetical protein
MTTPNNDKKSNVVQELRNIRDEISKEIKDMTFEEERTYLDQLLANNRPPTPNPAFKKLGQT